MFLLPGSRAKSRGNLIRGPWRLLNTMTANASASLQDTTSLVSGFTEFEIIFVNIIASGAGVSLQAQFQVNGTFQASTYTSLGLSGNGTSTASNSISTGVMIGLAANWSSTVTGSGRYLLSNPSQTSSPKQMYGDYFTSLLTGTSGGTYTGSNGAVTGLKFLFTSGNITSGTIKILGRLA